MYDHLVAAPLAHNIDRGFDRKFDISHIDFLCEFFQRINSIFLVLTVVINERIL
jgi:hypothetical protein